MMIRIKISIILLFLLVVNGAGAQTVGLVLSGGGAKGLYHVGVIKALEENNIPIDYVSGTSMGAIVGGMYAIGMTPAQMEELFLSSQIKNWLTGKMESEYMYYFKQMQRNAGMITLRLDLKNKDHKPQIPSNLVSTAQLDMAFIDFFSGATVACNGDFNELFIPFRCIATDAINRHEVVYRMGDVGKSVRTSMSIPLIFPPIESDSTLLYDGGIYNNFPWQVLEEDFTPDILIGSKCVTGRVEFNDSNLLDQAFALTMMHTNYSLPADKGVEIERVFNDISMMDFNRSAYIMQCGYDDTMLKMESIKKTITRRMDSTELADKRAVFRDKMPDLVFNDYQISGLNSLQTNYVKKVLKINKQNPVYSYDQFKSEYFKLIADGEIDVAYPKVSYTDSTGLFRIAMKMKVKPSFKVMVGGNISSTSLNQAYFGIEYRHIRNYVHTFNLDTYFSSFYSSIALGGRTDFFIGSPYYTEYRVLYNYYNYFRSNYGFLSKNNNISYSKFEDKYGMWAIGRPWGRHSVVNLTGHIGEDNFDYFLDGSGENVDNYDNIDRTRLRFVGLKFEIERDKKNFMLYPTRGTFQNFHVNYIYGRERFYSGSGDPSRNYGSIDRQWGTARFTRQDFFSTPAVKWFSWGYLLDVVASTHPKMGNDYATNMTMPSFSPIPHSMVVYLKEFRSPSFVGLGVIPSFEINDKLYMQLGAYAYMPEEYLEMKSNINRYFRYIFNASVVYQTFIGAASVSFTKYDISRNNWFCTFNFGHAIFNKRGLYY